MRIRKIMLLLCALMLILAACSSGTEGGNGAANNGTGDNGAVNNGTANNGTANNSMDEGTGEEEVTGTPEMAFDLGGKTVKVVSWWDMTPNAEDPDGAQVADNLAELEAKHNFKMEFIAIDYGEYQQKVTASLLAGEPIGDIVRLGKTYTVPALVKQDLLWPIDEYTKNEKVFNPTMTNNLYTYEGRGYGFTEDKANLVQGVFYNKTLMNQLGIKPLQDYVDEDNWNWETFIQVAKEANKDTNNDGKLDTWGLANASLLEQALASNNTGLTKENKQNLDAPATQEALNFVSRIATEQVARPTEGGDWTEPGQFFRQGNTLMLAGAMWEIGGINTDMPDYEIGFVPLPKGPSAAMYYSYEGLLQALTIPKAVPNPEQLMYIWEKMYDIESVYEYPGQSSFESNFTNEDDINNAKMVQPNLLVLDHHTFPNLKYYDFEAELLSGVSVSTVVEKYRSVFQAGIDEVYGS